MVNIIVSVAIGIGVGLLLRPVLDSYLSWRVVKSAIVDRARYEASVRDDAHV
ncbi:MAG: hypothetical protein WD646_07720 [Actinomycetota bacterium]